MSKEKAIHIIEFLELKSDWDGWSEKFLAKAEHKGYRKLLLGKKNIKGFDVIPTESEYDTALTKATDEQTEEDKNIIQLAKLNRMAYMDLILSIDHKMPKGKVVFRSVKNSKSSKYPEGNYKIAWDRLVQEYSPKSTPSLLKLKKKFENARLEDRNRS